MASGLEWASGMKTQSGRSDCKMAMASGCLFLTSAKGIHSRHLWDRLSSNPHRGQVIGVSESHIFWVAAIWKPPTAFRINRLCSSGGKLAKTRAVKEWWGMKSPVPFRLRFVMRKWGQACRKTLQILSQESSIRLTPKCSGPEREASGWICQPKIDKYLFNVEAGPKGRVPSNWQARRTILMASSWQMVIRRLMDLKIDKMTYSSGSSKRWEREKKQASQGDAKLHLPWHMCKTGTNQQVASWGHCRDIPDNLQCFYVCFPCFFHVFLSISHGCSLQLPASTAWAPGVSVGRVARPPLFTVVWPGGNGLVMDS